MWGDLKGVSRYKVGTDVGLQDRILVTTAVVRIVTRSQISGRSRRRFGNRMIRHILSQEKQYGKN